jgi:hypothetical protein
VEWPPFTSAGVELTLRDAHIVVPIEIGKAVGMAVRVARRRENSGSTVAIDRVKRECVDVGEKSAVKER